MIGYFHWKILEVASVLWRLLLGVDDLHKLRLEGSPANEEAVNIGFLGEFLAIGGSNRSSVDDAKRERHLFRDILADPCPQLLVYLLCLLGTCGLSGSCESHQ